MIEKLYEITDALDGATIAAIKAAPELFDLWRDLGKDFLEACILAMAHGADAKEQMRLIEMQTHIQTI